jgi:hypothetical protein
MNTSSLSRNDLNQASGMCPGKTMVLGDPRTDAADLALVFTPPEIGVGSGQQTTELFEEAVSVRRRATPSASLS